MESHHHHETHDHDAHQHGAVAHQPAADADEAYRRAYAAALPDLGRRVVPVELEAREIDWEFSPGTTTRAWGYNGRIPGPVIEARVGDVLEVRFTNRLPQPTNIHWHGLRVPAAMDGTEMVQRSVASGETFVYRFRLPDAGTFWYHPHSNETVQLEMGLYGALIVRAEGEPQLDAERVLVLDDVRLDKSGQIAMTVLLYDLLKPVSKTGSALAAAFGLIGCTGLGPELAPAYRFVRHLQQQGLPARPERRANVACSAGGAGRGDD